MLPKYTALIFVFAGYWISINAYIKVGLIYKTGEEELVSIVEHALNSPDNSDIVFLKEVAEGEDTRAYHQAFCRLFASGIDAFISSAASPYYSLLSDYANEYHIPFITPELPQSISLASNNYSFGIRPITTRTMLRLFQMYRWDDVVYLYDHDDGPENLSFMFAVGRRVLNLTLDGISKVTSAEEANRFLQKLDKSFKSKSFHVVLDIDASIAREILRRHVSDIHVRKKNFHFVLANPTLDEFWSSQMATFGAINVTAFLISNPLSVEETFMQQMERELKQDFDLRYYYFYDAALTLRNAARQFLMYYDTRKHTAGRPHQESINCLESSPSPRPNGMKLTSIIKEINIKGTTGRIQFENGQRTNFDLNVTEVTPKGLLRIGRWSNGNLYSDSLATRNEPPALPLIQTNGRLQIVSLLHAPYMMLKTEGNTTNLEGNDRFEGYCKDLIDYLAKEMNFEYDIHIVEDGLYGKYEKSKGRWSGIIGELVEGKADLAVADLIITGKRHRVVDFTDPFEMVEFSLLMKNPRFVSKLSSVSFFLSAFTVDVWVCILFAIIIFTVLFHFITKFTGAPDSIESASGIWGRKHAIVVNLWFVIGSSMFQSTGVYPRSISSRILSGFCWFFTLILSAMFVASVTSQLYSSQQADEDNPQLAQLKAISLETIISESVAKGWPEIGLIRSGNSAIFMQKSTLPIYKAFSKHLENNPGLIVNDEEEGMKRVRESNGNYMLLVESLTAEYYVRKKPCDVIATHDSVHYAGFGLATPLGSDISARVNEALMSIQTQGVLGHIHRKWLIDSSECKDATVEHKKERTIHVFSGLMCVSAVGFLVLLGVFGIQYIRRNHNKESRRQQLSFEDMNLGQSLPTPPPELLAEPAPVLNLPEYDKKTLL